MGLIGQLVFEVFLGVQLRKSKGLRLAYCAVVLLLVLTGLAMEFR
jgi:hypothetical protein